MLPASMELNGRLRANIMTVRKMGLITVFVVGQPYLAVRTSLIQVQAGHLSRCLLMNAAVGTKSDRSFFMVRTEVHCSQCEAHLGHVFEDGPVDAGACVTV